MLQCHFWGPFENPLVLPLFFPLLVFPVFPPLPFPFRPKWKTDSCLDFPPLAVPCCWAEGLFQDECRQEFERQLSLSMLIDLPLPLLFWFPFADETPLPLPLFCTGPGRANLPVPFAAKGSETKGAKSSLFIEVLEVVETNAAAAFTEEGRGFRCFVFGCCCAKTILLSIASLRKSTGAFWDRAVNSLSFRSCDFASSSFFVFKKEAARSTVRVYITVAFADKCSTLMPFMLTSSSKSRSRSFQRVFWVARVSKHFCTKTLFLVASRRSSLCFCATSWSYCFIRSRYALCNLSRDSRSEMPSGNTTLNVLKVSEGEMESHNVVSKGTLHGLHVLGILPCKSFSISSLFLTIRALVFCNCSILLAKSRECFLIVFKASAEIEFFSSASTKLLISWIFRSTSCLCDTLGSAWSWTEAIPGSRERERRRSSCGGVSKGWCSCLRWVDSVPAMALKNG